MFHYALGSKNRTCAFSQRQLRDGWIEMWYPTHAYQFVYHRQRFCLRAKFLRLSFSTFRIVSISDLALSRESAPLTS